MQFNNFFGIIVIVRRIRKMENKNGRGIFYGVIGVATLVVAIIGATFAYFTATANTSATPVTATGGTVSLTATVGDKKMGEKMIPLDVANTNFAKGGFVGVANSATGVGDCHDKRGNEICSVFTVTLANPSASSQKIFTTFVPTENTFTNLYMAIFKGTIANVNDSTAGWKVDTASEKAIATAQDGELLLAKTKVAAKEVTMDLDNKLDQVLAGNGNTNDDTTFTILVWIDETDAQQDADQGKTFSGYFNFSTASGDVKGVTAVLE